MTGQVLLLPYGARTAELPTADRLHSTHQSTAHVHLHKQGSTTHMPCAEATQRVKVQAVLSMNSH